MVTITVRPLRRYSPLSILCEKRPELSSPKSVTPFSLAALLALSSSKEGLAAVSVLNVLAMPVTFSFLGGLLPILRVKGQGHVSPLLLGGIECPLLAGAGRLLA
jgi:hypothetical protein